MIETWLKNMKNHFILFIIVFLCISFFYECKKEKGCTDAHAANFSANADEDDGTCKYWVRSMQAKVDGTLIICDSLIKVQMTQSILYSATGTQKGGQKFIISSPMDVGTYHIPDVYYSYACSAYFVSDNNHYFSEDGYISVTYYDSTKIKGTFNFLGVDITTHDTVNVTEGIFDLQYKL